MKHENDKVGKNVFESPMNYRTVERTNDELDDGKKDHDKLD
jgi:hypothetical protein